MNLKIPSIFAVLVLLFAIASFSSQSASAVNNVNQNSSQKNDLKSIMETYKISIAKAKSDMRSAVQKANENAKVSIGKGLPIEQINASTKTAIAKAKIDLKEAIQKAKAEAKTSLYQLKKTVDDYQFNAKKMN